jgi:HAMP domain-containing protein
MRENTPSSEPRTTGRFRFSLASLLLFMAVLGLAIMLGLTYRKLHRVEQELSAMQPISPQEVARQFEQHTTLGPITTKVDDVRYSPKADAYKVGFSFVDSAVGVKWSTEVMLKADGFGAYHGQIMSSEFIKPLGVSNSFNVSVQTRSPLEAK